MLVSCRHTEDSHVKTNTVHTLFRVQKYGLMPLAQFEDILTPSDIKRCKKSQHAKKTWYSLNLHVFTSFIFQVIDFHMFMILYVSKDYMVVILQTTDVNLFAA